MRHLRCFTYLLAAILAIGGVGALNIRLPHVLKSISDMGLGVYKDSANLLPTPQGLFDSGKQLLVGYPFEFVSNSINQICSSALASQTIMSKVTPDINLMQFQLRTACNKYSYPLLKANDMWMSPEFDRWKKVVILATGWTTSVNDTDTIDVIAKAYNCRGDTNFVAIDVASFVDTLYTWAALNTEDIGKYVAKGLEQLSEIVPVENIHLIGHSLGAHIMGAAGRHFTFLTNQTIPRITGLDPAKPCFNEGENLSGLLRGDADFIDIIHSNSGVLGKRDPLGDVDFYPNGLSPVSPGCLSVVCAHARSWEYYGESVYPGNERNFMAARCSSLTRLREKKCPGQQQPMGYAVPHELKGNYFLDVHSKAPFGQNGDPKGLALNEKCGLCHR